VSLRCFHGCFHGDYCPCVRVRVRACGRHFLSRLTFWIAVLELSSSSDFGDIPSSNRICFLVLVWLPSFCRRASLHAIVCNILHVSHNCSSNIII
jgi:hypothetical protein